MKNRKSFSDAYHDYSVNRAYLNIYVCLVVGILFAIGSIIGAFYEIRFLFGLIFALLFFIVSGINYLYYRSNEDK